jgi:hypothetical protein
MRFPQQHQAVVRPISRLECLPYSPPRCRRRPLASPPRSPRGTLLVCHRANLAWIHPSSRVALLPTLPVLSLHVYPQAPPPGSPPVNPLNNLLATLRAGPAADRPPSRRSSPPARLLSGHPRSLRRCHIIAPRLNRPTGRLDSRPGLLLAAPPRSPPPALPRLLAGGRRASRLTTPPASLPDVLAALRPPSLADFQLASRPRNHLFSPLRGRPNNLQCNPLGVRRQYPLLYRWSDQPANLAVLRPVALPSNPFHARPVSPLEGPHLSRRCSHRHNPAFSPPTAPPVSLAASQP